MEKYYLIIKTFNINLQRGSQKIAILPQTPTVTDSITVEELVSYGRFPHQKGFGRLSKKIKMKLNGH